MKILIDVDIQPGFVISVSVLLRKFYNFKSKDRYRYATLYSAAYLFHVSIKVPLH